MIVVTVFAAVALLVSAYLLVCMAFGIDSQLKAFGADNYAQSSWLMSHVLSTALAAAGSLAVLVYAVLYIRKGMGTETICRIVSIVFPALFVGLLCVATSGEEMVTRTLVFFGAQFVVAGLIIMNPVLSLLYFALMSFVFFSFVSAEELPGLNVVVILVVFCVVDVAVNWALCSLYMRQLRQEQRATDISLRDELTGIKNRRCLREDFEDYMQRNVYLMLCDIDDFKFYNDHYNYDVGDRLLCTFARILQRVFGDYHVYRYGGDEFLVILPGHDEKVFAALAQDCASSLSSASVEFVEQRATFSGGFTWGVAEKSEDFRHMLRQADSLLHEVKRGGKKNVKGAEFDRSLDLPPEQLDDLPTQREVPGGPGRGGRAQLRAGGNGAPGEETDFTGLVSMRSFQGALARRLQALTPESPQLVLAFLDLANFKNYNHRFGFEEGNKFLAFVGSQLMERFPELEQAHVAADKFVFLAPREGIETRVESFQQFLRSFNPQRPVESNMGLYEIAPGELDNVKIADCAKLACDSIKQHFAVTWRFYDDELRRGLEQRQYVIDNIDNAIEQGWLSVHYQPIIDLETQEVCEYEALSRWNDPSAGPLEPRVFVAALEEFSRINTLDLFVVEQVCTDYLHLQEQHDKRVPVSINISRLDFALCDIVADIEEITARLGCPHEALHFEVTESAFVLDEERIRGEVERLRTKGFEVWMDDFGSGYSSLNVLNSYDFDLVKIDMELIQGFERNEKTRTMLPYIVEMTKKLGIKTLSEGVETTGQLEYLREIGCEKAQGFLFSPALPLDECVAYAKNNAIAAQPGE